MHCRLVFSTARILHGSDSLHRIAFLLDFLSTIRRGRFFSSFLPCARVLVAGTARVDFGVDPTCKLAGSASHGDRK
eukprot:jgi/Pico_ML_1/55797/g1434.t1